MLLGIWKNVEDLENHINLNELSVILEAARERDYRNQKFMAAIQGIDIDKGAKEDAKAKFEQIETRVQARLQGRSVEELEYDELGLDVEIED